MKVNSIDSMGFEAKKPAIRTITKDAQVKAKGLLKMMNDETAYQVNEEGTNFTSKILASISMDNAKFTDNRLFLAPSKTKKDFLFCTVKIGKNELNINAQTGEITSYKKSLFKTWKKLHKQVEETLNTMLYSFDDKSVVTKNFLPLVGFTKKGFEIFEKKMKGM